MRMWARRRSGLGDASSGVWLPSRRALGLRLQGDELGISDVTHREVPVVVLKPIEEAD